MARKPDVEYQRRQLEAAIEAACARIGTQSSKAVRQVRMNAERKDAATLVAACDAELALRGDHEFTAEEATAAVEVATSLEDKPLRDRIVEAFEAMPARDYEEELLRVIDAHPGANYAVIHKEFSRKDTALVAGHMVYDRFGYFRSLIASEADRASMLLIKAPKGKQGTWQLRPEAQEAFASLGVLQPSA